MFYFFTFYFKIINYNLMKINMKQKFLTPYKTLSAKIVRTYSNARFPDYLGSFNAECSGRMSDAQILPKVWISVWKCRLKQAILTQLWRVEDYPWELPGLDLSICGRREREWEESISPNVVGLPANVCSLTSLSSRWFHLITVLRKKECLYIYI